MSRSRRKPYFTDGYGTKRKKISKRQANKAVRRSEEVSDGKGYRKEFNTYNISDFSFYSPKHAKAGRK